MTSASRNPAARLRPGSLIFLMGNLSTVRSDTDNRLATSARRRMRGTTSAGCGGGASGAAPMRSKASSRARSVAETVGSAFRPALSTSKVVDNIQFSFFFFPFGAFCAFLLTTRYPRFLRKRPRNGGRERGGKAEGKQGESGGKKFLEKKFDAFRRRPVTALSCIYPSPRGRYEFCGHLDQP